MTFYSLRILERPLGASADELQNAALEAATVLNLEEQARSCGPYVLRDWANSRGAEVFYVDNCWVRAGVLGRDLPAFLRSVLNLDLELPSRVAADQPYLIEAEEF